MANIIYAQYREVNGQRILQCHSWGDQRYSPFYCMVEAFGIIHSIENHYQRAKVFAGSPPVRHWKEAKQLAQAGVRQVAWQIGPYRFPVQSNEAGNSFTLDDWGVQWYAGLWFKYLILHPERVDYARQFDDFEDPFQGNFPLSQAEIIRIVTRHGIDALRAYCQPLFAALRQLQSSTLE
jgi:hypothetical protein